jgi:hypothetical protein
MGFRAALHLQKLCEAFVPMPSSRQLARCAGCGCYAPLGVSDAVCLQCDPAARPRYHGPHGARAAGVADGPARAASRAAQPASAI